VALEKLVRRLQKEVEEYRFQKQEDNDKIECLTSIVGVSKYMAVVFYTEFANKRFETKKSMYAFVGYDPKLKQSGSKMIGVRISKRGNAYTRKKLYQCAFCAIQHCEAFQNLYKKMKEK
jgi:transposase